MDYKTLIALLAFIPALVFGQPMSISELAWPSSSQGSGGNGCGVGATNSFASVAKNTAGVVPLHGAGGTYSIFSGPLHGSLSSLDASAGTVTYTPDSGYTGADVFTFQVSSNTCSTNALVFIGVFDTNSVTSTCVVVSNVYYFDVTMTVCSTLTSNGVTIYSGCSTTTINTGNTAFNGTNCVNYVAQCDDVGFLSFLYTANGGTYTFTTADNWFKLDGHNPGVVCPGPFPPASTVAFSICNNAATNRTLAMFGSLDYASQACISSKGVAAHLDVNGSRFTFTGPGTFEIVDCDVGSACGLFSVATISNAIVIAPHSSTNILLSTRIYRVDGGAANDQHLSLTNFWLP